MSKKWLGLSSLSTIASSIKTYVDGKLQTLTNATLEAVTDLDETKQEKLTGKEGNVLHFDSAGLTTTQMWSNDNLLINADFRFPRSQNGNDWQLSGTDPVPIIDGWYAFGNGEIHVNNASAPKCMAIIPDSISENFVCIYQDIPIENGLFVLDDFMIHSVFGRGSWVVRFWSIDANGNATEYIWPNWSSSYSDITSTTDGLSSNPNFLASPFPGKKLRMGIMVTHTGGPAYLRAAKLERGQFSTLARINDMNEWVLIEQWPSLRELQYTLSADVIIDNKLDLINGEVV